MRDGLDSSAWIGMHCWAFTRIYCLPLIDSKGVEGLFHFNIFFGPRVLGPCCSISSFSKGGAKVGFMILSHVNCCCANLFVIN